MILATWHSIRSISGANISHTLIFWVRSGSLNVSMPCYHGFVIHPLRSIIPDYFTVLQGAKVQEDQEVRRSFYYLTEGAPEREASQSVVRYTGSCSAPAWMDVEEGGVFRFNSFVSHTKVKQTSSKYCAISRRISPPLRIKRNEELQARYTIRGTLI